MMSITGKQRESGSKSLKYWSLILTILLLFSCEKYQKQILVHTGTIDASYNSASVQGEIVDAGEGISQHGHCWAISPQEPTVVLETRTTMGEAHESTKYTSALKQLLPGTAYNIRAYAITDYDSIYGKAIPFTTRDGVIAFYNTQMLNKSTTSIKCTTTITEDGGSPVTSRGVCWSRSLYPTVFGDTIISGKGNGEFSIEIKDLEPGTLYNIRFFANNDKPVVYSKQISERTDSYK